MAIEQQVFMILIGREIFQSFYSFLSIIPTPGEYFEELIANVNLEELPYTFPGAAIEFYS